MTDPAAIPMKPGYYWAKLRVPADGTHEAELWGFNDTWEIVQVNDNSADWEDNPAEPEALSVSVPGIRETQWRDGFVWGPFVASLGRDMHSDRALKSRSAQAGGRE